MIGQYLMDFVLVLVKVTEIKVISACEINFDGHNSGTYIRVALWSKSLHKQDGGLNGRK